MTKQESTAAYAAYAELEAAAEAFYAAVTRVIQVLPESSNRLNELCEDINCAVINVDDQLDEVL